MNYVLVLREKKFKKSELPKTIQKKISVAENLVAQVKEFDKIKDLSTDEKDNLVRVKSRLEVLDKELIKSINKFDPKVYQKKLEVMDKNRSNRHNPKPQQEQEQGDGEKQPEEKPQPQPEKVQPVQVKPEEEVIDTPLKEKEVTENINRLDEVVYIQPELLTEKPEPVLIDTEEIDNLVDEFEKVANAKPKKSKKGLLLIGIGVLFLTWGAVNILNDRK